MLVFNGEYVGEEESGIISEVSSTDFGEGESFLLQVDKSDAAIGESDSFAVLP